MYNVQNYSRVNINTNYGTNKSPNFKAFVKVNGGKEKLEHISKDIAEVATRKLSREWNPLTTFETTAQNYIEELTKANQLKKVADNTKYFNGFYNINGNGELGIGYKYTENIYTEPFELVERNGRHIIQGSLVPKEMGECKSEPIMELTKEEAEKLSKNPTIADVLQACENSVKQKIKQIQDLARDLM